MKTLINATLATAIGFGAAVAAIAIPAQAGEQNAPGMANTRSLTVPYRDLDLSKKADADVLYGRLKAAANKVCAPKEDMRDLTRHHDWKRCYNAALDEAVTTIAHVGLSQVHLAETGRRIETEQQVAGSQ